MEQYQYQPLPNLASIRLLKLHPGKTFHTVACTFVVADTTCPPPYIALSYVWGDATDRVTIHVEGKPIHITSNLHNGLCAFSIIPALVWADALCIKQEDIAEWNQQVNLMSTIYHQAANVTVWLEPDEHNDAPVLFGEFKALIEGCGRILDAGGRFGPVDEDTGDLQWQLKMSKKAVNLVKPVVFL